MKKPSDRILEIRIKNRYSDEHLWSLEYAILQYLDEQWETRQEENCKCENFKKCGHKVWRNYQGAWGGSTPPPQKECVNCGITI